MNLSEPFIRRPVMTAVLTISVILFGTLAYFQLPVNDLPVVDYPVIQVGVGYPGASPETVANNIATPLERQFLQINGLELITSKSEQGSCSITLQFSLDKNIDAAATDVQTAISQATGNLPVDLPNPPTFSKSNPNDQPFMYIALTSDTMSKGKLYELATTRIGQRISIISGVSKVDVYGAKSALRIKADPKAMWARNISIDDLSNAIQRGTSYSGAGQFDSDTGMALLRPKGQLETPEEYGNLIIATNSGGGQSQTAVGASNASQIENSASFNSTASPVYLKDVAEVKDSLEDERVDMRFALKGRKVPPATVIIAVSRQAGANLVKTAGEVRGLLPIVNAEIPGSVQIVPVYDRSVTVSNSVLEVQETLLIAFALVVIVIFVFLGRASDTLIPAVALPLSLLLTFITMYFFNYSLDNLSLMALTLAIGFLVDDAIVFLENTVRRMEKGEKAFEASINSAKEISFTILSMTISLAAVFIPLVFMPGQVGRIFREFAITIIVAIIASGIVSLTLTPLMCARMLKDRGHGFKKTWMERVMGGFEKRVLDLYGNSLWWFLKHKSISLVIWVGCLIGTVMLFMYVPKAFLPVGDSNVVFGIFMGKEGSSYKQMRLLQDKVDASLRNDPNVRMYFTMTGASGFLGSNMGLTFTFLEDPKNRIPYKIPIDQAAGMMMGNIASNPGVFAFIRPMPVLEINTGSGESMQGQYTYTLSGTEPALVYAKTGELMGKMDARKDLFASVSSQDLFMNTPSLDIELRRDQAKTYGVSESRIMSLLQRAYSQNYVYLIKKPEDQYKVILEMADDVRSNPEDLALLRIRSDDGKTLVPLGELVKWKTTLGPQSVNHLNQFTSATISFNVLPGVPLGKATDFIEATSKEIVPNNVRAGFQGEAQTFANTVRDLTILMLLAVFVMYVILAILYESYVHPLTVLSTLPPALIGGLATLVIFNQEASLYAFVGLFMLMGIVKKNGIMIVDFARQRVDRGEAADKAIHDASMDRFRPIIMTTLAAVIGAVPIAIGFGADGASRRPLGLVIVGGLIVSQFITLYVTPVIYLYLEWFQENVLDRSSFFKSKVQAPVHGD